jgi:hypothetical protein
MTRAELSLTPYTKENLTSPLDVDEAVELFTRCTQRVGIGRVFIIWIEDDSIVMDWNVHEGFTFPNKHLRPRSTEEADTLVELGIWTKDEWEEWFDATFD